MQAAYSLRISLSGALLSKQMHAVHVIASSNVTIVISNTQYMIHILHLVTTGNDRTVHQQLSSSPTFAVL
jgi:hypothetical protein